MVSAARLSVEFDSKGVSGVKNDIAGVGKALDSTNGKGQSFFSNMMSTAGGFMLAGGFNQLQNGILGVGSSIINANSNMEMWTMQLAVSTGSMDNANAVIKDMQNMAKISPFDLPELIQGANALESLGFSSQKWMTVIGDTAAGTNKSVDQVVQAMMDASTGEFERLKELGIRTEVDGDKIRFSFMKNGQMMVVEAENTSEGIENALFGIWDDKYGGAMETMADTWTGRLGNFKDTINMALMDFGKPLFDTMKEAVSGATMFLETFIRRVDQGQGIIHSLLWSIPETLRNMGLGDLANTITPAIKGIETAWNRVGRVGRTVGRIVKNTLGAAFEFLGDHMDVVRAAGKALLTVFGGMFAWGAITAIIGGIGAVLAALLSPIALLIAGVTALYLAWDNNWFGIRDAVSAAWNVIEPVISWIQDAVGWIAEGFQIGGWSEAWDRTKQVAETAWAGIRLAGSFLWTWLSNLDWGGMIQASWDTLKDAGTWLVGKLGDATEAIRSWFEGQFGDVDFVAVARGAAQRLGSAIGEAIADGIELYSTLLAWITEQINGVDWNNVGQTVGQMLGVAFKAGIGLLVLASDIFKQIFVELKNVDWDGLAANMWSLLKTAALAALNFLVGIGQGIMDELGIQVDSIDWTSLWDPILQPFKDGFDAIVDFARERINDLISLYNAIPFVDDIDLLEDPDAVRGSRERGSETAGHRYWGQNSDGTRVPISKEQFLDISGIQKSIDLAPEIGRLMRMRGMGAFNNWNTDPTQVPLGGNRESMYALASSNMSYSRTSQDTESQNKRTTRSFDALSLAAASFVDGLEPMTRYGALGQRSLRDIGREALSLVDRLISLGGRGSVSLRGLSISAEDAMRGMAHSMGVTAGNAANALVDKLREGRIGGSNEFGELARKAALSLTGINNNARTTGGAIGKTVLDAFSKARANGVSQSAEMGRKFALTLTGMNNSASTTGAAIGNTLRVRLDTARTTAQGEFGKIAGAMTGAMATAVSDIGIKAGEIPGKISGQSQAARNAGYSIGTAVADGASSGINAQTWAVEARARAMALAALAAAKAALGIRSPSREFMKLFAYVPEGAALGIEQNTSVLQRAMESMVSLPGEYALASPGIDSFAMNAPLARGGGYGGTQIIDNSTHTTEYIALTEGDFQRLLAQSERAAQFADERSNPAGAARYAGMRR